MTRFGLVCAFVRFSLSGTRRLIQFTSRHVPSDPVQLNVGACRIQLLRGRSLLLLLLLSRGVDLRNSALRVSRHVVLHLWIDSDSCGDLELADRGRGRLVQMSCGRVAALVTGDSDDAQIAWRRAQVLNALRHVQVVHVAWIFQAGSLFDGTGAILHYDVLEFGGNRLVFLSLLDTNRRVVDLLPVLYSSLSLSFENFRNRLMF